MENRRADGSCVNAQFSDQDVFGIWNIIDFSIIRIMNIFPSAIHIYF